MIKTTLIKLKNLVAKGFIHLFISNFLIQFMIFGSQMIVAGFLLPEDLGRIKVLQAIVDISAIIGGGGLVVSILKLIPETTNVNLRKFTVIYALKFSFLVSTAVFLFLNFMSFFNLLSSDELINTHFHVFSLVILLSPVSLILVRYYQAQDNFKKISILQFITKTISVGVILLLTYYYLINGYIIGVVLSFLFPLTYMLFDLRKDIFANVSIKEDLLKRQKKQIIKLSKFNFLGQVTDQFRIYVGFFIANYFILDRELFGQYSFSLILIQGLGVLSSSVQQFVLPNFSRLSADKQRFLKELKKYERDYFLVALLVFICAQLFLPFLIKVIFYEKYSQAIPFFRVLLVGWLIYSAFTLKGAAFIGLGRLDITFKTSLFVLICLTPVLVVMCWAFGIWGIVYGYVLQCFINLIVANKFLNSIFKEIDKKT